MRIGFDAKRLFNNFTGLGNYSRSLLKNLASFYPQNDYHLYTPSVKITEETNHFLKNPIYYTFEYQGFLDFYWRSYGIIKQLKTDQIQLYHGLSHELPIHIRQARIPSIVTIHDLIFKIYPKTYPALDRKIYDLKCRHSCLNADRIIAISQSTKNDIVDHYQVDPNKIDVIYQSCHPMFYLPLDPVESQKVLDHYQIPMEYLLYVGTIEERKNLKTLIASFAHLPNDLKIPLVVIGKGKKYMNEVKAMIQSKGLNPLIIWLPRLEQHDHIRAFYRHAAALIYPSLYEGFGLPVAEALLSKTPVITSLVSSLPEAGGPDSIYINPGDELALADSIQRVLQNDDLRIKMKENGYVYAKNNFDPSVLIPKTMHAYEKTMA